MFQEVMLALCQGFLRTLELFFLTLLGALPLGLLLSFGSMCRFRPLKYLVKTIVWIVRGTPLMLQIIIIFYGPGLMGNNIWANMQDDRLWAATVTFIINYACYFSEIYRGGIESISKGQSEAGQVLGMTRSQIFFKVTLKQVVKRIIPPMSNEIITLVKDTSIAKTISFLELIYIGDAFRKSDGLMWPRFATGIFYLAFSGILTLFFGYLEKKLSYFQ